MAITLVQHGDSTVASVASCAVQFPNNVTVGNFLTVAYAFNNSTRSVTGFADDHFGNWTGLAGGGAGVGICGLGYLGTLVATGGVKPTFTLILNGTATISVTVMEWNGVLATIDAQGVLNGTTSVTTASVSTSAATTHVGELSLACFGTASANTYTAGSGYTLVTTNSLLGSMWLTTGAVGVQTASMTAASANAFVASIATWVAGSPATVAPTTTRGFMAVRTTSQS